MNVLVAGGAGYIGSHTVEALVAAGHKVTVYDSLVTGHMEAVPETVLLIEGDLADTDFLKHVLVTYEIDAVMHFAAFSLVGDSMERPEEYYRNNVLGTFSLLGAMKASGVDKLVFSSTAAVYGEPEKWPIEETALTCPTNVYGRTKLTVEGMLADYARAYELQYVSLRYFNAAGAAKGGYIGEDHAPETHLLPLVLKTALGQRKAVQIFGTDYPTEDGTCVRDYVHVEDLAAAHVLALNHLARDGGSRVYNLGSERGFSVRQVVDTAKKVTGVDFTVEERPRRAGDPAVLVASSERIRRELGWQPKKSDLETIVQDAWAWHKGHPRGFA